MILLVLYYYYYLILGFILCIPASAADAAAVNANGIKMLLANDLITFFIIGNPVFNNVPKSLPGNSPDWTILDNWVFDSIISLDDLLAKALQKLATCLLFNKNSWGKLVSSSQLPIMFDYNLKTTSDLSYEAANLMIVLNYCIESFYFDKNQTIL